MNKNSKYVFFILVVFILVAVIWYFLDSKNQQDTSKVERPKNELKQKIINLSEELQKAKKTGDKQRVETLEKEIESRLPDNLKRIVEHVNENTFDLDFYGKVIDQHGEPVSNAKIDYSMTTKFKFDTMARGVVETDQLGMFDIKASGYTLSLRMPMHPKLSDKFFPGTAKEPFTSGEYILLEPTDVGREIQSWQGYSKNNPYTIKAWKVKSYEKIFHKRQNLFLVPDGSVHSFLQKNKYGKMTLKKGRHPEGFLLFSCTRDESQLAEKNGSWQATIEPIDGGILETTDIILNEAPLDGYQPSLSIIMDGKEKYGSSILKNKKYYFKSDNNRIYGSLVITFDPYAKKRDCIIDINYKINLNGSRNLAIPSQQISK